MMKNFFMAFIPLFVAVDAIGVLPIFISFTEGLEKQERTKVIFHSVIFASSLAIGFIFLGKAVFNFLNITVGDFMVAGGVLLFGIALTDILRPAKRRRLPVSDIGFVPLGTPLIVGPAVLTTSLLMLEAHGVMPTLIAMLLNIVIAGIIFLSSDYIIRIIGVAGSRALSKVTDLLLAAIAVMMIRRGIIFIINLK